MWKFTTLQNSHWKTKQSLTYTTLVKKWMNHYFLPTYNFPSKSVNVINFVCTTVHCRSNSTFKTNNYPSLKSERLNTDVILLLLLFYKYNLRQNIFSFDECYTNVILYFIQDTKNNKLYHICFSEGILRLKYSIAEFVKSLAY